MTNSVNSRQKFFGTLGFRIFVTFAALTIALTLVIGAIGYVQSRKSIIRHARDHLESVALDHHREISRWLSDRTREISLIARLPEIKKAAREAADRGKISLHDSLQVIELFDIFHENYREYGPCGLFDTAGNPLAHISECHAHEIHIAALPEFAAAQQDSASQICTLYAEDTGAWSILIFNRVTDEHDRVTAVLTFALLPETTIDRILEDYVGLGHSGEIYLVDEQNRLLTPPRYADDDHPVFSRIETRGVEWGLTGLDSSAIYPNYAGKPVVGAFRLLPQHRWVLMAEMDLQEALQPLQKIKAELTLVGTAFVLGILLLSILISRQLTRPIHRLAAASSDIAQGNLEVRLEPGAGDEVSELTHRFNEMVKALRASRHQVETSTVKLLQAEKLADIGKLVASIVHEMRNPLSTVKMNLRILEKRGDLDEAVGEHLLIAKDQVARLEKMLNELLEYSKPVTPNFSQVTPGLIIESTIQELHNHQSDHRVSLKTELPAGPIEIESDADLLHRILDNLLSNAQQNSPDGAEILVEMTDGEEVVIRVIDQGRGMSDKVAQQIFEPFFTTRADGVGLGMSNVKKFVELIDARIEVQSAEGAGTTFTLTLPKKRHG